MIIIKNLTVGYTKDNVLELLTLTLQKKAIHGIAGLNGTGKTTLFNTLYGLKKAKEGDVLYNDKPLSKKDVAYLPAENYFFHNITGREYLSIFRNASFDLNQWNELFKLPLDRIIDEYSTGMKKKLALLGVIKQGKPVILLDEPFNGLDLEMNKILHLVILRLKETGKTILISSHILETLTNLCDTIHYLENKTIRYSCSKNEFPDFEKMISQLIEKDHLEFINSLIK